MPGQRNQPNEIREKLSQLIRYEQRSMPTASFGRIKEIDEDTRRATIETTPDGATLHDVPIATPFAADGAGDIMPLNPTERDELVLGLVLYLHHPIETVLSTTDELYDYEREHEEENAIFLPAQVWTDGQTVPWHYENERKIQHTDGSEVHFDDTQAAIRHHLGGLLEAIGEPEPDHDPGIKDDRTDKEYLYEVYGDEWEEHYDDPREEWPIAEGETAARVRHPDGHSVTTTRRGVALETDRNVTVGPMTDGDRQPLAGPHQHFHLVDHGHDEYSLAGPQLSFREFIAWFTDEDRKAKLRNVDQYEGAQAYAERYLEWLEAYEGREIDPTDEADWPDPEPMPYPAELDLIEQESHPNGD